MTTIFLNIILMSRFRETNVAKEEFYGPKLIGMKNNSK